MLASQTRLLDFIKLQLSVPQREPEKPPELSWHDYLVVLLQIGASIEHALMLQYLSACALLPISH